MKEVILNEYAKKWLLDLNLTRIDKDFKEGSFNALLRVMVETKDTPNNTLVYLSILLIDELGVIDIHDIYGYQTSTKDNNKLLEEIKDLIINYVDNNFKDLLGCEDFKKDFKVKDAFKVYEIKEVEG